MEERAEHAYRMINSAADYLSTRHQTTLDNIEFVFSGFSRGAAISVATLNLLVERGLNDPTSETKYSIQNNKVAMVLYDMVPADTFPNSLNFTLPTEKLKNFGAVHMVSDGFETRETFDVARLSNNPNDSKVRTVRALGVHSDVGGGYEDNDNLAQLNWLRSMNELSKLDVGIGVGQFGLSIQEMSSMPLQRSTYKDNNDNPTAQKALLSISREEHKWKENNYWLVHDSSASFPRAWLPLEGALRVGKIITTGYPVRDEVNYWKKNNDK